MVVMIASIMARVAKRLSFPTRASEGTVSGWPFMPCEKGAIVKSVPSYAGEKL